MGVNMKCENWHSDPPGGLKFKKEFLFLMSVVKCFHWFQVAECPGGWWGRNEDKSTSAEEDKD